MGPKSAFSNAGPTPIPCYDGATAKAGCWPFQLREYTSFDSGSMPKRGRCALRRRRHNVEANWRSLRSQSNTCYAQGGGFLTPPAYGTSGNAGNGIFTGPGIYRNVDFSVAKIWTLKERYSAQFRVEFFNLFNRADFNAPGLDPSKEA